MKWVRNNWEIVMVLLIAGIVLLLLDKFVCNHGGEFKGDKKENDSLATAMQNLQLYIQHRDDSMQQANKMIISTTENNEAERRFIIRQLDSIKNKFNLFKVQKPDTSGTQNCIEQLTMVSNDFSNYIELSDIEHKKSDSINASLKQIIANSDSIAAARLAFNQQLQASFKTVQGNYDTLYKSYTKLVNKKPKKFGLGVQVGTTIGSNFKPKGYIGAGVSWNFIRL